MKPLQFPLILLLCSFWLLPGCGDDEEAPLEPMIEFSRADYLGTYSVAESCPGGTDSYNATIAAGTTANAIMITNLYNLGDVVRATVANDALSIPMQLAPSFREFSGSGTLTEDQLELSFVVTGGLGSRSCTAVFTPQ